MPEWYAGVDYVLSTSDFESFHFTVADGAAAGCVPVVLPWEGADEIYPRNWISPSVIQASNWIKENFLIDLDFCTCIKKLFDVRIIYEKINNVISFKS